MSNIEKIESARQYVMQSKIQFEDLAKIHKVVNWKEESAFALQILSENEYLAGVAAGNPDSLKNAILNVAIIGLSLNPYKAEAYLIPRKGKVCLDISYRGYIQLGASIGAIRKVDVEIVHKNDDFRSLGAGKLPQHVFNPFDPDRGPIVGGYIISTLGNGEITFTHMKIEEIDNIRDRSESWIAYKTKGKKSPWVTDRGEMIKKTLVRRARKLWPAVDSSGRMAKAQEIMDAADPILLEAPPESDSPEREQLQLNIRTALDILGKSEDRYIKHMVRVTGHEVKRLSDLTTIEMKQGLTALSQMVDKKTEKETK